MDIYNWINVAQKKIRFRRRRAKFREEIFRRYRCRLESLTAEGMDPEAAKKTVMEELGDPEMQGSMVQDLHRQHWMPLPEPEPKYFQQNIYVWIHEAARQLLSRRKRNELRRAAGAYYHARVAELTAGGMEQREAEKKAMAAFGDAKRIGRAARHKGGVVLLPLTLRYWKPEEKSGLDLFAGWLSQAAKPVYFPPDRRAVEAELVEHFEERVEGFTTHGMGSVEAMRSAVERLGDPRQTGALLRKVHKPWLGWLLRTARVLLVLLVLLGLYRSAELKKRVEEKWEAREKLQYYVDGNINHLTMNGEMDYYVSAPCAIRRGTSDGEGVLLGHRVRFYAANAFWWRTTADPEAFYFRNYLVLQVETPLWTTPDLGTIRRHLKLLDENGEEISYYDFALSRQNLTSAWYTIKIDKLFDQINLQYQDERSSFEMQVDYGPREDFFERAPASNEPEAMDAAFEENVDRYAVKYYTAEPVQIDGLELSVREAYYKSKTFDPEDQTKRGSDINSWLSIQLELRGPSERIPVDGLKGKLRLTDAEGNKISFDCTDQRFCEDRVDYLGEASGKHVQKISGGPNEWYELRFQSESGSEVTLQLVPVEGE